MTLRKLIISFFTFIGGFYFFLEFLLPKKIGSFEFGFYHETITTGVRVVGTMAIGLGIFNILKVHGKNLIYRRKHYINSIALLLGLATTLAIQIADYSTNLAISASHTKFSNLSLFATTIEKESPTTPATPRLQSLVSSLDQEFSTSSGTLAEMILQGRTATQTLIEQWPTLTDEARQSSFIHLREIFDSCAQISQVAAQESYDKGMISQLNTLITEGFFVPLGSAMFSLLAFYIAYAAYRSFRVRSKEAAIMMATAIIVMLGQIPFGPLYISESLPGLRLWLLKNVSTPAFRAIYFGAAIAGLSMAVRMWLSMERSPLESHEESGGEGDA